MWLYHAIYIYIFIFVCTYIYIYFISYACILTLNVCYQVWFLHTHIILRVYMCMLIPSAMLIPIASCGVEAQIIGAFGLTSNVRSLDIKTFTEVGAEVRFSWRKLEDDWLFYVWDYCTHCTNTKICIYIYTHVYVYFQVIDLYRSFKLRICNSWRWTNGCSYHLCFSTEGRSRIDFDNILGRVISFLAFFHARKRTFGSGSSSDFQHKTHGRINQCIKTVTILNEFFSEWRFLFRLY